MVVCSLAAICRVSAVPVDVAPSMQKLADARTRWEADRNHVPNQTTNSVLHDQKPYLWTKQTSGTFGEYTQACPAPSRNARRSLFNRLDCICFRSRGRAWDVPGWQRKRRWSVDGLQFNDKPERTTKLREPLPVDVDHVLSQSFARERTSR
jgi:hypothetical protein